MADRAALSVIGWILATVTAAVIAVTALVVSINPPLAESSPMTAIAPQ